MSTSLALHERFGRREPQLLDLLVYRGVFFNVSIRGRDVGFGLVVVVIRDEILDGVIGEEAFEFVVELRREGFVVRHDQGRALQMLYDLGDGVGFARAGYAEQGLVGIAARYTVDQSADGFGLVARGLEGCAYLEALLFSHCTRLALSVREELKRF